MNRHSEKRGEKEKNGGKGRQMEKNEERKKQGLVRNCPTCSLCQVIDNYVAPTRFENVTTRT